MAVDLTLTPWNRLAKLAPPSTSEDDLVDAASRHLLPEADVYAAAADLWEEKALTIDVAADPVPINGENVPVQSITQDGISVTYSAGVYESQTTRMAQRNSYMQTAANLRKRSKLRTVQMHVPTYDPYTNRLPENDNDDEDGIFIPVIP